MCEDVQRFVTVCRHVWTGVEMWCVEVCEGVYRCVEGYAVQMCGGMCDVCRNVEVWKCVEVSGDVCRCVEVFGGVWRCVEVCREV